MKDGRIKHIIENGHAEYDDTGNPACSKGTLQDVTESKKLEFRQKNYMELIDQNIIVSSTDLKGYITNVSQAFCDISGYSRDDLVGKRYNVVRHPDVDDSIPGILGKLSRLTEYGKVR